MFHSVGAATLKDLLPEDFFIFPAECSRLVPELECSENWPVSVCICNFFQMDLK